jgi:hypothetical protein
MVAAPGRDFVRYGSHALCLAIRPDGRAVPELRLNVGTGIRKATALLGDGRPFLSTIAQIRLHRDQVQGLPLFTGDDARTPGSACCWPSRRGSGSRFDAWS